MPVNFFKNQSDIETRVIEWRTGKTVFTDVPQISVVIPCYNGSALICETLESVFAQTFLSFEVVIVNDGSPDTKILEENLERFFDRIIYIKQENCGAAAARNTGIHFSRGKYIAFLDGDDLWLSEYLAEQVKCLTENGLQMIYANALLFGQKPWDGKTYMETSPSHGAVSAESLISTKCNVITSGTIVEKEELLRRDGFDESADATRIEDFDLWVGLAKQGCRIGYQKRILLKYRVSFTGLSGGNISRAERSVQALQLIKKKHRFTERELIAWDFQFKLANAQLELEKGKFFLVKENFEKSLLHLIEANKFFQKKKLRFLIWLVENKPQLVKMVYKNFRAAEFEFVDASDLVKD